MINDEGTLKGSIVIGQGPKGDKGEKGDRGEPGIGIQGPKGDKGDRGEKGEATKIWFSHDNPTYGEEKVGDIHINYTNWGVSYRTEDEWESVDSIKGEPGSTILTGTGNPGQFMGKNLDLFINTETGELYKKTDDVWILNGSLIGPQGIQGPEGPPGDNTAEILEARGSYNKLGTRLDTINTQLEQTMNQIKANMFRNIKTVVPTDFQAILPFDLVFDKNLNATGHTFDLNQFKMNFDITIYVNRGTGNDETGTGSISSPFRTPSKAWTYLQSATWSKALINVSGAFKRSGEVPSGWTIPSGKTLSIIGDNNTNFYSDKANLSTWTVDGNSYKTSRSSCYNVIDLTSTPDENGLYKPLTEVSSISICQNTLNSWYTDGTNVWVHTKDNRMPDINMELVVFSDALKFTLNSNSTLYLENIMKRGNIKVDGVNGSGRVVFNNVKTCCGGGSQSNGFDIDDVNDVYSFDCITAYNVDDGFNYHYINTTNPKTKLVFEYNCKSYENGRDTGDQATTCHEGVSNIRVNGTYTGKTGTALTDVQDCDTVLLGCKFTSTIGEAVNVSDAGSRLTMVNCLGYTQNPYKSIKAINARLRDNIVNQDVNITNAILI